MNFVFLQFSESMDSMDQFYRIKDLFSSHPKSTFVFPDYVFDNILGHKIEELRVGTSIDILTDKRRVYTNSTFSCMRDPSNKSIMIQKEISVLFKSKHINRFETKIMNMKTGKVILFPSAIDYEIIADLSALESLNRDIISNKYTIDGGYYLQEVYDFRHKHRDHNVIIHIKQTKDRIRASIAIDALGYNKVTIVDHGVYHKFTENIRYNISDETHWFLDRNINFENITRWRNSLDEESLRNYDLLGIPNQL